MKCKGCWIEGFERPETLTHKSNPNKLPFTLGYVIVLWSPWNHLHTNCLWEEAIMYFNFMILKKSTGLSIDQNSFSSPLYLDNQLNTKPIFGSIDVYVNRRNIMKILTNMSFDNYITKRRKAIIHHRNHISSHKRCK